MHLSTFALLTTAISVHAAAIKSVAVRTIDCNMWCRDPAEMMIWPSIEDCEDWCNGHASLAAVTNSLAVGNTASIDDCDVSCDASGSATIVTARNIDSAAADVAAADLNNDSANSFLALSLEQSKKSINQSRRCSRL